MLDNEGSTGIYLKVSTFVIIFELLGHFLNKLSNLISILTPRLLNIHILPKLDFNIYYEGLVA